MKNKKLLFAALALVLVIALMAGVYLATRPQAVEGQKNVTIVIVYKDGTEKKLEYATTHEYLSELLLEKELVTGYASEEYGFTIESVDGITLDWATDGAYWAVYEGEEYALQGIDTDIDPLGTLLVSVETHLGELGLDHSGANLGHSDAAAQEVDTHTL